MINNYYTRKFLIDQEIESIKKLLSLCKKEDWIDGIESLPNGNHDIKKVKQLNHQVVKDIDTIVMNALQRDQEFLDFTVAKHSSYIMITKMEEGDYYHTHHDSGENGHFSTTIFISEKSDYEGGELCLTMEDRENYIKLDSGESITYNTGIVHRVNKIASGKRIAIVFWTTSKICDPWARDIYKNLSKARYLMYEENYKESEFLIEGVKNSVLRRFLS